MMTTERQIHLYPSSPRRSIKRILCSTDLTQESNQALLYAVALAQVYGAKLYICHCVTETIPDGDRHLTESLKDIVESFELSPNSPPLDWEGILVKGRAAEILAQEAFRYQVDLIVINSRQRPYATLLGSTTESISRTAPCPVLVTHSAERNWIDSSTGTIELKKILVAYDFSDQSDWAFSYALSIAEEYGAEIHLLNVVPIYPENPFEKETLLQRAKSMIKRAVPKEAYSYCCKIFQVVREGQPYREILAYAKEKEIDLICMGAQGIGHDEYTLFGSNSDRVLRQSPCPVLIAHPFKWYSKQDESREAKKILIAIDGSSYGEAALRAAAGQVWPQGSKLRILTVMEPVLSSAPIQNRAELDIRRAFENIVSSAAETLRGVGRVISYVVREGYAADEILAEAKEWGANQIFIGTHGRPADSRVALGSVAENVSVNAPCRVVIVPNPLASPEISEAKEVISEEEIEILRK